MIDNVVETQKLLASSKDTPNEEHQLLLDVDVLHDVSRKNKHTLIGRIISNKMQKTVTVLISRRIQDRLYRKYVTRSTKLHVHDETNKCKIGDTVEIEECRPISKTKSWRLSRVIGRASLSS